MDTGAPRRTHPVPVLWGVLSGAEKVDCIEVLESSKVFQLKKLLLLWKMCEKSDVKESLYPCNVPMGKSNANMTLNPNSRR